MPDATVGTATVADAPEGAGDRDEAILTVSDLELSFGGVRALAGTDLDVLRGSITALIGPNGAGKTTLFNAITGFYAADRGEAFFDGQPLLGKPPHAIARLGMARTFQLTKTLAAMPVLDNMMLAAPDQPGERLANAVFRPRGASILLKTTPVAEGQHEHRLPPHGRALRSSHRRTGPRRADRPPVARALSPAR